MNKQVNLISNLVLAIGFSAAILIPIFYGSAEVKLSQIMAVALIALTSVVLGDILVNIFSIDNIEGFSDASKVILGFSVLSILILVLVVIFKTSSTIAFTVLNLMLLAIYLSKSQFDFLSSEISLLNIKISIIESGVLVIISMVVTLWCGGAVSSFRHFQNTGLLKVWPDIFLHSTQVRSFISYLELGDASYYLSGTLQPLYHAASYALTSVYADISHDTVLGATIYFWVPVGIVLMGYGVYAFGAVLAGRFAGFVAVISLFLIPDASSYGLENHFFSFHWLLQTSPGSGYALALILIGLGVYTLNISQPKTSLLFLALILAIISAAFRVQIAIPAVIMFVILIVESWPSVSALNKRWMYWLIFILLIPMVIVFENIALAPHFLSGYYPVSDFFDVVHSFSNKSFEMSLRLMSIFDYRLFKWGMGYLLYLTACLGLVGFIVFLWAFICVYRRSNLEIAIIPIVLAVSALIVILFIPVAADGDVTNFGHRQFVLLYAVFFTILVAYITKKYLALLEQECKRNKALFYSIACIILCGLYVPWYFGKNIQQPDIRAAWAYNITNVKIPLGLLKSSEYIRMHSRSNDAVLSSNLDPLAIVVALTERPAHLSRQAIYINSAEQSGVVFRARKHGLDALADVSSYNNLYSYGKESHVRWLLQYPEDWKDWPKDVTNCALFSYAQFKVYDLTKHHCS